MREALTINKQLITFHMRFQTPQLLLLHELLQFHFTTQLNIPNENKSAFQLYYMLYIKISTTLLKVSSGLNILQQNVLLLCSINK